MIKKIIALFLAIIIFVPYFGLSAQFDITIDDREVLSYTDENQYTQNREYDDIVAINVKSQEPTVLFSSIVEESRAPVFVYLDGITTGAFTNTETTYGPLTGELDIRNVNMYATNSPSGVSVVYHRPLGNTITLSDMGYLIVNVGPYKKEADVPEQINLNVSATIFFRFKDQWQLNENKVLIEQEADEQKWWNDNTGTKKAYFWAKNGILRAEKVDENYVYVSVYDYMGQKTGAGALAKGVARGPFMINTKDGRRNLKLTLEDVVAGDDVVATVDITRNGKMEQAKLKKGTYVPGTKWRVENVLMERSENDLLRVLEISRGTERIKLYITEKGTMQYADYCISSGDYNKLTQSMNQKLENGAPLTFSKTICTDDATKSNAKRFMDVITLAMQKGYTYKIIPSAQNADSVTITFSLISGQNCQGANCALLQHLDNADNLLYGVGDQESEQLKNTINYYKSLASGDTTLKDVQVGDEVLKQTVNLEDPDTGEVVSIKLKEISMMGNTVLPEAKIKCNAGIGDKFTIGKPLCGRNELYIKKVYSNYIEFCKINQQQTNPAATASTATPGSTTPSTTNPAAVPSPGAQPIIPLSTTTAFSPESCSYLYKGSVYAVDNSMTIELIETDPHYFAIITVDPFEGDYLMSKTSFKIHVPIEERTIKFSDKQVDSLINKTDKFIKDLDNVINKFEKVLKVWKIVCMSTFAFLAVKNSFFMGSSRAVARKEVVSNNWKPFCNQKAIEKRQKGEWGYTMDSCFYEYSKNITKDMNTYQKSYDNAMNDLKGDNYKKAEWFTQLCGKSSGEECAAKINKDEFKDLAISYQLNKSSASFEFNKLDKGELSGIGPSQLYQNNLNKLKSRVQLQDTINNNILDNNTLNATYGTTNTDAKDKLAMSEQLATNYQSTFGKNIEQNGKQIEGQYAIDQSNGNTIIDSKKTTTNIGNKTLNIGVFLPETGAIQKKGTMVYPNTANQPAKELVTSVFCSKMSAQNNCGTEDADKLRESNNYCLPKGFTNRDYVCKSQLIGEQQSDPYLMTNIKGTEYLIYLSTSSSDKYFISSSTMGDNAYFFGAMNSEYAASATVEFTKGGDPNCIPFKMGNQANLLKVVYPAGQNYASAKNVQYDIYNVGKDGKLCTNDDIFLYHFSNIPPTVRAQADRALTAAMQQRDKDNLFLAGKNFKKSSAVDEIDQLSKGTQCQEFMDPQDCQIMFNVCDPVMCPVSRFNLAGRIQVDNVVKSGFVGSIVLGLPNFKYGEPVPICLTGVNAALQNLRSLAQAFKQCLITQKIQGQTVGICDKIRSVGVCEILWRELMTILKTKKSILDILIGITQGNPVTGGQEYSNFGDSLQNTLDTTQYFVKDYASTAFEKFQGKNMDEWGTEVCKAAIYAKVPGIDAAIDELAAPESPPQFTAILTEKQDYAVSQGKSHYELYYHLYAGEDQDVRYTVYLKNPLTGTRMGMTERCRGGYAQVGKGGFADYTINCIENSGMTEVCVQINNNPEKCGFLKVSDDFGINYINQWLAQNEMDANIDSEEKCVPTTPRASPRFMGGMRNLNDGIYSAGIIQVCAMENPGLTDTRTSASNWQRVGTCGTDAKTKSFMGFCWRNMETVRSAIIDEKTYTELKTQMEETNANISMPYKFLTQNESEEILSAITLKLKDDTDLLSGGNINQIADLSALEGLFFQIEMTSSYVTQEGTQMKFNLPYKAYDMINTTGESASALESLSFIVEKIENSAPTALTKAKCEVIRGLIKSAIEKKTVSKNPTAANNLVNEQPTQYPVTYSKFVWKGPVGVTPTYGQEIWLKDENDPFNIKYSTTYQNYNLDPTNRQLTRDQVSSLDPYTTIF